MRHRKKKNKINRSRSHTKATFNSIASSVIEHERITTTLSKARKTQPMVDKLITLGKRNDLHSRRLAAKIMPDKKLLKSLFDKIAPRFKERNGGYTRVVKKGYRNGDNAIMAILELVEREKVLEPSSKKSESKSNKEKDKEKQEKEKKPDKQEKEDKKGFVSGLRGFFKKKN